ncbi:MAG: translocation/assembly module TamB domain-containing protein [Balneolaceae bacterium]|nr:translocation/assembly module TamB domain-containing protein [Balneolaceae bacterium]
MSSLNKNSKSKSRRKWPWIVLFSIIGLVVLGRLALMTGPVHSWVKETIVETANNQLRPQLSIGTLSGDLWTGVTLTNVNLTEKNENVASIDTVHLEYSPLSYFSDTFQIHEIRFVRPFLKLRQKPDSSWNIQDWVVPAEDTTKATFAFTLSNFLIQKGQLDVKTIQFHQDSSFIIDEMNLASSLAYYGDEFDVGIDDFSFKIKETNLDAPVSLTSAADINENSITLGKLAIATGHSMLNASGRASLEDSTAQFKATTTPLGWQDLAAYVQDLPIQKDIRASLNLNGDINRFEVNFNADATGIDRLSLTGNFQRDSLFALTSFDAAADRLDLATFMSDTTMPRLRNLDFKATGRLPLENYQQGRMSGTLSASNLRQGQYRIDAVEGTFSLDNEQAKIRLAPVNGGQRLIASANISRIWDENPSFSVRVSGNQINPARWLQDETYTGNISFTGTVVGRGWMPEQNFWSYQLDINKSTLMKQQIDSAALSGRFNESRLTNQSTIVMGKSRIGLKAEAQHLHTIPLFNYTLNVDNMDLSALNGFEEYPSAISGTVEGSGQGRSLENLKMQAAVKIDSSIFRGEMINKVALDAALADSVLNIKRGNLTSSIADASFSGQVQVTNMYDVNNNLDLDVQLKDISSFASVAEVDILQATGNIQGALKPIGRDSLIFDGMVELDNVNYNEQFIAPKISGGIRVELDEQPKHLLDVDISRPTISSVVFKNITFKTEGQLKDTATEGSFSLDFYSAREGQISQAGTYRVTDDTSSVELTTFDLTSSLRTLSLQKPFHASFANGALQTDTLHINSKDQSAFMELAIPYADTLHQKAYLKGKNLNLAVIQEAALDKVLMEGVLFGEIQVGRTDTSLTASGDIVLSNLMYRETELDTLQLQANIEDERLTGLLELHQDGDLIAEGAVDIPFEAKDPVQLDDGFFEKPVSGFLRLHTLKLDRFSRILEQLGYQNTKGTIQFDGNLTGKAGQPELNAKLSLTDAQLSGVPVDSLIASANYRHQDSDLNLNAVLISLKQKAMEVDARMPLNVDLRDLDVSLAGPQDSISVDMQTNNFDLKALNDFMDRSTARNLQGRVNGNVKVRGPRSDLQASGEFTLRKGAVRVVPAGIRLDHIKSTIQFEPDRIVLSNLHMESGRGDLDASGELALQQLVPGDINLTVKAENFKAANTNEYNALVNLDMQVAGSVTRPKVTGSVEMINGFIALDNFGEKSVETIELDTMKTLEPEISLYDSLSMDMNLEFNRRFFVRNQRYLEMEIELDGQLDILKDTGGDLQLFGTLSTPDGYARPLGKRFELVEGSLAFSGPPDNPQINVRTLYEPPQANQEVKIWYVIEGTVEDPQFKYESQPPMDLAGIISYTLFGQPFYKLNSAEQSIASASSNNAAADFAMEVLLDRVESIATKRLGIDVVRIETTRIGGESGTSITTGWYINPKVFFAIQNVITGSTPTTGFYLEYYLRENLKLILSQRNDNRQGVDLQWEYDY